MNGGSQFVENLKKLNYPKVSRLKGEDFDWLFETPEHKQFLRWFCAHARKRNVLSAEEVGAFAALEASGQAILDEAALAKVLKTCRGAEPEGGPASLRDLDPAQLEEELQALRREKRLKLQRRGQLQVMAAGAAGAAYRLGAQREEASAALKETLESLGAENAKMNRELQLLVEEARQLTAFFSAGPEREAGAPPSGPPVFLSQLALGPYLHQEELNTKALALYTQKQFFRGISDLVESSNEENFQLLDLSGSSERGEDNQVQQGRRKEMAKLQCTHIMAQHRLIQASAKEESTRAGLQWIRDNLHSTSKAKPSGSASVLQVRAAGLWQELEGVRAQARALLRERIPAALRASAQLLYMPVVRGDLDLQIARQDYYTSRQDEVCRHLLRQKASFELLQLACELELRRGRQLDRQLGDLTRRLQGSGQELGRRLEVFSQPALSAGARPRNVIDSRDTACSRLYQVLEGAAGQEQPIRTYGGLEQAAQALRQELRAAREAVEGATEEQRRCLAGAEADCELLRSTNYCGLKQLVLTPQELGESLLQLESQLNTLNQLMQEISSDVKAKKTLLERRKLQRLERDLYVYFFQDEDLLKSIVKELENKTLRRSCVEMELRTLPEGSLSVSAQKILAAIREQYTDRTAKARQSRQTERGSERSQGSLRRESRSGFWEQTVPVSGCRGGAIRGKESLLAAHFPSGVNQGKPAACYKERAQENGAQTGLPGRAQTAQLGARHAESRGAEAVRPLQADVLRMKRFEQESNWGSGCCQTDSLESVEPSGTNASQISDLKPDRMRYSSSLGTEDTFSPSGDQRHSLQQPDLESRRLAVERKSSAPVSLEGHKMENQFERSQSTEIPLPCGKPVSSGIPLKRKRMTLSDNAKKPGKWEPSLDRGSSEKPETGKEKVGTASAGLKSPVAVTSEAGVCDASRLSQEERALVLRETAQASVIVLTMVYQDGTAQLNAEQKSCPPVSGVLVLLKSELDAMESEGCSAGLPGSEGSGCKVIFLKLEQRPAWAQQGYRQDRFSKEMLLCILGSAQDVICFKAKDLLCTALQYFGKEISWKQVALCRILDPQIAAWLLDPADTASCFWDLVAKRCKTRAAVKPCAGAREPNVSGSLLVLYRLMMDLRASLQEQGLWKLFCSVELRLTTVLAVMEIHRIHVDKDALEKTSKILGMKLKQLEQEAHQAAGQQFLVSSSSQLRVVLFEKLRLHERCENKKLPKTVLRQQQSTSEATLMQLQDLHPLPKIILEYRQVHKIKSAYVDGILSCMSKTSVSSTWNQTGTVSGRLSAKHPIPRVNLRAEHLGILSIFDKCQSLPCFIDPVRETAEEYHLEKWLDEILGSNNYYLINELDWPDAFLSFNIQAIPRQSIQIIKKQYVQGKEPEVITIHPRSMFISEEGWTFLAADFSQVELRLLAHLSSDPELLRVFQEPLAAGDVFISLASQWKGLPEGKLKPEDREQAKRIVYSVVYGAGKERLSEILGLTAEQAGQFVDSFLQKYKQVRAFTQKTIQQCQDQGCVVSIMGRRRRLPHILSPDWTLRNQAERQAVNFVVQGSAADLCKMAMIRIFSHIASSPTLTARLIAQIHDELLFEVEDSQVEEFAGVVQTTMESLQHIDCFGVHLKVPLRVTLSSGKSWGSLAELARPRSLPHRL